MLLAGNVCAADIDIPDDIGGVSASGDGGSTTPYTYDYSSGALDIGADNILNTNLTHLTGNTVFTNITTLSYGAAGTFDWRGWIDDVNRPYLKIYASSTVEIRSIYTGQQTDNTQNGDVTILSSGGKVTIDDVLNLNGVKTGGDITIDAMTVEINTDIDVSGEANAGAGAVSLTAHTGTVSITGSILADVQKQTANTVTICTYDDISIAGNLSAYQHGTNQDAPGYAIGGTITMTSTNGDISVGGTVSTSAGGGGRMSRQLDGGSITITAAGNIFVYALETDTDSTNTAAMGGDISITSSGGNVTISNHIYAQTLAWKDGAWDGATNGDLTISANGTITLPGLNITNFGDITLSATAQGIVITGAIDGLTIDQGAQTVKGGFTTNSLSGSVLCVEAMNPTLTNAPYSILDKDTDADTGCDLVTSWSQLADPGKVPMFRFR